MSEGSLRRWKLRRCNVFSDNWSPILRAFPTLWNYMASKTLFTQVVSQLYDLQQNLVLGMPLVKHRKSKRNNTTIWSSPNQITQCPLRRRSSHYFVLWFSRPVGSAMDRQPERERTRSSDSPASLFGDSFFFLGRHGRFELLSVCCSVAWWTGVATNSQKFEFKKSESSKT